MSLPRFPERYTQIEALASTPLERTFRAFDTLLQREVLLRLPAEAAWAGWSVDTRTRLLREAQSLAKVQHEGAESVLWVEETQDGLLVVQALPSGERLADHLKQGPMGVEAVVDLGVRLGEALAAVHYAGIVHRGIGPDAVRLRADGRPVLGGFHFAKAVDQTGGGSSLNHGLRRKSAKEEDAVWLPAYSAPEQLQGKKADARADVYALGCLLFRCLAGHDPLPSGDGAQMPDVRSVRPEVPKALAEVLRRCMLAEKTARFPTAQSVVEALKELRQAKAAPGSRRSMLAAAVAAVAVVGIGAVLWPEEKTGVDDNGGRAELGNAGAVASTSGTHYSSSYARGHALLIGIGEGYDGVSHAKLKGPRTEVLAVKDRLMKNHPELWNEGSIELLLDGDATKAAVYAKIEDVRKKAKADDAVLIYFAGHGLPKPNTNRYFLVCADARSKQVLNGNEDGFFDGAELDFTGNGRLAAKHVLVVADCCYSGRLFPEPAAAGERGRPVEQGVVGPKLELPFLCDPVVEFLGSSSSDETAKDAKDGDLSRFCRAFLAGITPTESGPRYVTARQLAVLTEQALVDPSRGYEQSPSYGKAQGKGQFVFWLKTK